MSERGTPRTTRSRRLPPLEAWKEPDKWIDLSTGLAKPYSSKLIFDTDDRGFLNPDQVVEQVEERFFWKDYDWPYTVGDQETEPDDHHFYYYESDYSPEHHNGSRVPNRFRELPTVIGTMPRQFHNTIHDFTNPPEMPDMEAMAEYYKSYALARQAFLNLIESAKNTSQASQMFAQRQRTLASGKVEPRVHDDIVAQEFMREFFSKHFTAYSRSVEQVMMLSQSLLIVPHVEEIPHYKPHMVVRKLGKYVARNTINYTPVLRAA